MLSEVVETGEGLSAMTGKGSLASMFPASSAAFKRPQELCLPDMSCQMLATRKHLVALAISSALKHLTPADTHRNNGVTVRGEIRRSCPTAAVGGAGSVRLMVIMTILALRVADAVIAGTGIGRSADGSSGVAMRWSQCRGLRGSTR